MILAGANAAQSEARITAALADADEADILLIQNETNMQGEGAKLASSRGMTVIYSAAPFDTEAVTAVLEYIDILLLNEIEAQQLVAALGKPLEKLPV